ncbi:MAG: DsbA family protein [Patescibacteria group bacterium]|nr:DsbA family protein [Patescibacteria group bacterium]
MEKSTKKISVTMGPFHLIMVVLLIVGAYFLGTLKTKVDYLERGAVEKNAGQVADQPSQRDQQQPPLTADNVPPVTDKDWVRGDKNAQIALIEYSDLECPFCKQFHATAQRIVDEYKGKVMWIYRHYPLSFHPNAQKAAEASECAGKLGGNEAFWKYVDNVYKKIPANGSGIPTDTFVPLAKEIGLDEVAFKKCLDSGEMEKKVKDQMDGGVNAGVSGTPGNILLNTKTKETRLIPGAVPFEQIKQAIDEMLKES